MELVIPDWLQVVILIAEIVTAITTITVFLRKLTKKVTQPLTDIKNEVQNLREEVKILKKHEYDTWIDQLRIIICSEEMPISERLAAGDIYVNQELKNGAVKCRYEQLLKQYAKEVENETVH